MITTQPLPIKKLNPATYNPRVINNEEFEGLVKSIDTFGIVDPLIVNKDYTVIGGHMRLRAAAKLKLKEVPCVVLDLNKHDEKKLNVLLNSQAISGKWDENLLGELLEELKLDDDYRDLRLDILEPLDLSGVELDESQVSSEDAYRNQGIKQIVLAFPLVEFEELMPKVNAIIKNEGIAENPSELFLHLVNEHYEDTLPE